MTALAADKNVIQKVGDLVAHPVAVDIIYKGALVKHNAAGYLAPCVAESGAKFAGVAYEQKDNSAGSAGDIVCRVLKKGRFLLDGSSFAQTDVGEKVYATDDQVITKTFGATSQLVGVIDEFVSSTQVYVKIDVAVDSNDDILDSEIALAQGSVLVGDAGAKAAALDASGDTKVLVGNATTITSVALSGDVTMSNAGVVSLAADSVDNAEITDNAVSLEHLDSGIKPSHIVVFSGEFTTAGGDATETINDVGIAATDIVHVTLHTKGAAPVTILTAVAITDNITVTMSADPSTDHVLSYSVLRAAA